jgi:hypothetical protein
VTYLQYVFAMQLSQLENVFLTSAASSTIFLPWNNPLLKLAAIASLICGILSTRPILVPKFPAAIPKLVDYFTARVRESSTDRYNGIPSHRGAKGIVAERIIETRLKYVDQKWSS